MPAPETTRSPSCTSATSEPSSTTRPTNSWPSTTPERPSTGPWSHSAASVPQIAARVTFSTTSPGRGGDGSATSSTRTSPAPWKTAALIRSALDLHLDVAARVPRGLEGGGCVLQREPGGEQRRGVDAARRHEADGAGPEAGRADDPPDLQRLRLHEADLDGRRPADVDPDEDKPCAEAGDREGARHRGRRPGRFDHHVEAAAARYLGRLLGQGRRGRIEGVPRPDLQTQSPAVSLRL